MMASSHMSSCPAACWSLTPPELWVATLAFPSVLWPCFAVAHLPHVDVSVCCCVFLSCDLGQPWLPVPVSCWLSYTHPLLLSLPEPQGRGPDLVQGWADSRFSLPRLAHVPRWFALIQGETKPRLHLTDPARDVFRNLDSSRCSVILLGYRMEMERSPEAADAVVTCASPLPVAHPATADWLATGGGRWMGEIFLICPAGKHHWMKEFAGCFIQPWLKRKQHNSHTNEPKMKNFCRLPKKVYYVYNIWKIMYYGAPLYARVK